MTYEIVEACFEVRWLSPVWVRVGNGMPEVIRGPKAALEQLQHRWPTREGESYHAAKVKCVAALSKKGLCEEAREEFVRASIAAEMLD